MLKKIANIKFGIRQIIIIFAHIFHLALPWELSSDSFVWINFVFYAFFWEKKNIFSDIFIWDEVIEKSIWNWEYLIIFFKVIGSSL